MHGIDRNGFSCHPAHGCVVYSIKDLAAKIGIPEVKLAVGGGEAYSLGLARHQHRPRQAAPTDPYTNRPGRRLRRAPDAMFGIVDTLKPGGTQSHLKATVG